MPFRGQGGGRPALPVGVALIGAPVILSNGAGRVAAGQGSRACVEMLEKRCFRRQDRGGRAGVNTAEKNRFERKTTQYA